MCGVCCVVFCVLWNADVDVDGSCVCDGRIMNVRIKMNVNVNPYSYSYFMVLGSPICLECSQNIRLFIGREFTCLPCAV